MGKITLLQGDPGDGKSTIGLPSDGVAYGGFFCLKGLLCALNVISNVVLPQDAVNIGAGCSQFFLIIFIIGIHHQNYQSAYKGKPAPSDTPMTARKRLEEKRPNTFIGRSFGVGDVIVWDEEKGRKFFYVDKEELVEFGGFMDADAAGNTVIYMVPNYQIDGKTGTWLPYDSEVVEGVCFFMMRNVITSTTMLYYGQLFVKI